MKKTLIISDSHIGSIKNNLDISEFNENIIYLPILTYKNTINSLLFDIQLEHDSNFKFAMKSHEFKMGVSKGNLFNGKFESINYSKIIYVGLFLIDRLIHNIVQKYMAHKPYIFPNDRNDYAKISIMVSDSLVKEMIKQNLEMHTIQLIKKFALNTNIEFLLIPGPPISKTVIEAICGAEYACWFNDLSFILKNQRQIIREELIEFANIKIMEDKIDQKISTNGFLNSEFCLDNGNIHANTEYGSIIYKDVFVPFLGK